MLTCIKKIMKNILLITFLFGSLFASAQNVGIGTAMPTEKLDITGNAKANSFKYTTPKTLYYSIADGEFTGRASNETVIKSVGNGGASITNGSNYGLIVPVHLPHNSKVISVSVDFYDASATQDLALYFVTQFASGFFFNVTIQSSGSAGLFTQTSALSPSLVIDNSSGSYEMIVAPTAGSWATTDLAIRRVIIAYTLDEAQ
jgi:hypothetical protein